MDKKAQLIEGSEGAGGVNLGLVWVAVKEGKWSSRQMNWTKRKFQFLRVKSMLYVPIGMTLRVEDVEREGKNWQEDRGKRFAQAGWITPP